MRFLGRAISYKAFFYFFNSTALAFGGALMSLDEHEWSTWWWAKKLGWFVLLIGNITNTMKALFSDPRKPGAQSY